MKIFNKSKKLEGQIENYLFLVQNTGLIFAEAVREYCTHGMRTIEDRVQELRGLEDKADELRRMIKHDLYANMLLPDARGDVLGLLETLAGVMDAGTNIMLNVAIENPDIPDNLKQDFIQLADYSEKAIDQLVKASSAFFTNIGIINEYINKVYFFEREVDKVEERIKRAVFSSDLEQFSRKVHIRYFVEKMAMLSDVAESVCERLAVSAIKRQI